jgi:microcystin-dependent protein
LPDLRGRVPIHVGSGHNLGQKTGEEAHTLSVSELPPHKHALKASDDAVDAPIPQDAAYGRAAATDPIYGDVGQDPQNMDSAALANVGGSQGHENMQPFLTITFCIALQGLFPSRN